MNANVVSINAVAISTYRARRDANHVQALTTRMRRSWVLKQARFAQRTGARALRAAFHAATGEALPLEQ